MSFHQSILSAWEIHKSRIESDPIEFARRLARRHAACFVACPRAWCLAVRASDRRINPLHAILDPKDAMNGASHEFLPHDVTLDTRLLKLLCSPVVTDFPYSSHYYLARKLGVSPPTLAHSVKSADPKILRTRTVEAARGRQQRVFEVTGSLDPGYAWHYQQSHHTWGTIDRRIGEYAPEDFEQIVRRIPAFRTVSKRLGRHEGLTQFIGFRWACPGCGKKVRTIYYPMPGFDTLRLSDKDVDEDHPDALPQPPRTFACHTCHRIRYFETLAKSAWNYVINQITGGLLYGREVPKPDWWKPERKRKYRPQLLRKADRRDEVRNLLLKGLTKDQIARQMQITKNAVGNHVAKIYAQHRVHTHKELAQRLGGKAPTPAKPRQQLVEQLLLHGLRYQDIAKQLGVGRSAICFHATNIYRAHRVHNRRELKEKTKHVILHYRGRSILDGDAKH